MKIRVIKERQVVHSPHEWPTPFWRGIYCVPSKVDVQSITHTSTVVLLTAGHLLLEHLDHAVKGAGTADFRQHLVELALVHELADVVKGGAQVRLVDGAVLVHVHKLEALLVHVDLVLGEPAIVAPENRNPQFNIFSVSNLQEGKLTFPCWSLELCTSPQT